MNRLLLIFFLALCLPSICVSQEPSGVQNDANNSKTAAVSENSETRVDQAEAIANTSVSDFLALTFILLMFTNAVLVGRWALESERNFWGWYIFALFTGPLAGGFMLQRVAGEKFEGKNPNGCLAVVLGLGIPAAGWFIWIAILK